MRRDAVTFGSMRRCWGCRRVRRMEDFSPVKGAASRRHHTCKPCNNRRAKEWYASNKDKGRETRKRWSSAVRERAIERVGGSGCACCGERRRSMLDIDHINGGGGRHRRERGTIGYYRDIIAEPHKYQLLCCNCNQSKRRLGECEHTWRETSTAT